MTVSHAIVILLTLTCQLTPKSNSHISLPLLRLYINYSIFQCISTSNLYSNVTTSTRINSSSVHTYIFVCFIRNSLRVILQGFVDPIMQQLGSVDARFQRSSTSGLLLKTVAFLLIVEQANFCCWAGTADLSVSTEDRSTGLWRTLLWPRCGIFIFMMFREGKES